MPLGAAPDVRGVAAGMLGHMIESLKSLIRDIPDFPKKGILFRDITPLLANPSGLALGGGTVGQSVPREEHRRGRRS